MLAVGAVGVVAVAMSWLEAPVGKMKHDFRGCYLETYILLSFLHHGSGNIPQLRNHLYI